MTIEFLTQAPGLHQTTQKLATFTQHAQGRIFLLTGNLSTSNFKSSATELEALVNWALTGPDRELAVLVGVFNYNGQWNTSDVIKSLAQLVFNVESSLIKKKVLSASAILPITFYAVKKWHAKAIGLSGVGGKFLDAKCAIFGSTNFSDSALAGDNIELDLYMDKGTPEGGLVLDLFIKRIGPMINEALKNYHIPKFHLSVENAIKQLGGTTQFSQPIAFN